MVYLVTESDWDSREVHGVFATEEAARTYIDGNEYLSYLNRKGLIDIDEWEVKG